MADTQTLSKIAADIEPTAPTPSTAFPPVSDRYRYYAVTILLLGYVLSYVDRQIVTILAEPIKRDLGLADWQLGAMTGLAFAVFYTGLGLPIARLAERVSRPLLIAGSMVLWSLFTMLCGRADTFVHMLLARMGVGFGEAGCNPAAHALIADYAAPEKRASSLAMYNLGIPIGTLLGLAMGGLMVDAVGWRLAFVIAGAPGILLGLVALLTLREPRASVAAHLRAPPVSFVDTLKALSGKKSYWLAACGAGGIAFVGYGQSAFIAPFFMRVHGAELAAMASQFGLKPAGFLGLSLGLLQGTAGFIGTLLGGFLADRLGRRDARALATIPAVACMLGIPFYFLIFTTPSVLVSLGLSAVAFMIGSMWYGPVYNIAQAVAPPASRATAAAIMILILSLVGIGLGPITMGVISDLIGQFAGKGSAEGLRYALLVSPIGLVVASPLFWLARTRIRRDLGV